MCAMPLAQPMRLGEPAGLSRTGRNWLVFVLLAIYVAAFPICLFASPGSSHEVPEGLTYFPCPFYSPTDGKWGFIDRSGKVVITPAYTYATSFHEGLAQVKVKEGIALIDLEGRRVGTSLLPKFVKFHDGMGMVFVGHPGRLGYVDRTGRMVIPARFDDGDDFSEGVAPARLVGGVHGYIDKTGKFVIPPNFLMADPFKEGFAAVFVDTGAFDWRGGFIDKTGKMVIKPRFTVAGPFSEGLAAFSRGNGVGFIDKTGKVVIKTIISGSGAEDPESKLKFSEGLASVEMKGRTGYINKKGAMVIDVTGFWAEDFHEGLALIRHHGDGRCEYMDKTGKHVIKVNLDTRHGFCGAFSKEGVAKVCVGINDNQATGCGFIDRTGKFIIEPTLVTVRNYE